MARRGGAGVYACSSSFRCASGNAWAALFGGRQSVKTGLPDASVQPPEKIESSSKATPAEPVIEVRGLEKYYDSGAGPVSVLRGIDLTVARGEIVALKGVSGSGKSTLLHILGAIEKPNKGAIRVCSQDLGHLS